ncbi:hypothetical protein [uncultured Paraglaciecola sp.]|uniref:hypothetical protein n=1 Tax=uncultured Paraglaciecola sp. TaxID=1765024 RepID=UPI0030DAFC24|tara:strand:- start:1609 stop:2085 length:477 start_codon:yes stop_codon:yes gene_type:complete
MKLYLLSFFAKFMLFFICGPLVSVTSNANTNTLPKLEQSFWLPVPDATLSTLRGGFVLSNGVVVDINFQKNIFRNGQLASHSYFQSPQDLSFLSKDDFNLSSVIPNGSLNSVLQNTIDNQTLSAITNIDITIKNLQQAQQAFAHNELYSTFFDARTHQ